VKSRIIAGPVRLALRAGIVMVLVGASLSCRPESKEQRMTPQRPIEDVLREHTPRLMALPGVVGTYQGALDDGRPCIGVMVRERSAELERRIPKTLDGYPVKIDVTGEIRALPGDRK
jgi:hypothetical protein